MKEKPTQISTNYSRFTDYCAELHTLSTRTIDIDGMYAVWRYDDVESIISNPSISNRNALDPFTPLRISNPKIWSSLAHLATVPRATTNVGEPVHGIVRRATIAQPGGLYPGSRNPVYDDLVKQRVTEAMNRLPINSPVDLTKDFAQPLTASVISTLVGFPRAYESQIRQWSDAQVALLGEQLTGDSQVTAIRALSDMSKACRILITKRYRKPQDDLASHLIKRGLSQRLAAAALMNIIAAGYATSYTTLLNSIRYLLAGTDHWCSDTRLPIDELLRLETGLVGWRRYAAKPVQLTDGSSIPQGKPILLLLGAANRDPQRPINHSLTFGSGAHFCVGKQLARAELTCALTELRNRFPDMRLVTDHIEYFPSYLLRAPMALPVTLQ
jgi:cytochrome P450